MPQLYINNFQTQFIASVKAAAETGSPATELDYGVLRVSDGAAGVLLNPGAGNWYVLTAYKRSGSIESDYEIMKVTGVDNSVIGECRLTVQRAQEGTAAHSYTAGDLLELRVTAGAFGNYVQTTDDAMSNPRPPVGAAGGVLSGTYPNPGFAQAMATATDLANKVDKVAGKVLSANDYTNTEKSKLAGIAEQATKNATDAQLRDRATHTGAQPISTITGLQTALDGKQRKKHVGDTAPSSPGVGDEWLDTSAGRQYVWIDGGSGGSWMELGPGDYSPDLDGLHTVAPVTATANWDDVPGLATSSGVADAALMAPIQALVNRTSDLREAAPFDGSKNYVAGTIGARLREQISVCDFPWLASPGNPDNTAAIQAALNTGLDVVIPVWLPIQGTVYLLNDGQCIYGRGKTKSGLVNATNAAPLFQIGKSGEGVGKRGQFTSVQDVGFKGNAATTEGVRLCGIADDGVSGAARNVCLHNIDIRNVGSGYGLVVNSWANSVGHVSIFDCFRGLQLGSEVNACLFHTVYITGCEAESLVSESSTGLSMNTTFVNLCAQYGGKNGTTPTTIKFVHGYSFTFDGVYLEGNKCTTAEIEIGARANGSKFRNVSHIIVDGVSTKDIVLVNANVKAVEIDGVVGYTGTVKSLVRVTSAATIPQIVVSGLYGTVSEAELVDESPRRSVVRIDGMTNRMGTTRFQALTTQNQVEFVDGTTGVVRGFFMNGRFYFGTDTSGAWLDAAGQTVTLKYGSSANARLVALRLGLGDGNTDIRPGTGSPEGVLAAPVGSMYLRTDGGVGSTLYIKESGTGNTGWAAK